MCGELVFEEQPPHSRDFSHELGGEFQTDM